MGIALLGSTGSIGRQVLDVVEASGDRFRVVALAAGRDAATFTSQLGRHRPRLATLADAGALDRVDIPGGTLLDAEAGALERFAVDPAVDLVVVATGGIVSLRPVLAALRAGKVVAMANKETLVAGGHLVMPLAASRAAEVAAGSPNDPMASSLAWLRPIDSEHSAIWQCLVGEEPRALSGVILTASGGPFREWSAERLERAAPSDALAHPTWDMGAKVTVDSATLMNKGLEVIEARWLYDVPYERIDVLIHPQSLIHSLVEFVDGSLKAQLGLPDMRIPIQYAVTWPHRQPGPAPRLDLTAHRTLTFEAPDESRFPALRVARSAGVAGPRASAALICADEVAVARFLAGALSFPGITRLVEGAVERFGDGPDPDVEALEDLDAQVRAWGATVGLEGRGMILDAVVDIVLLLVVLVVLVVIHELGHFVVAKRAGVRVHEFGIGFPPRAMVLHRGPETVYSLNWLPIGGFVRLEGEEGESADARAFVNQRLRTRLAILVAGVAMNFALAWLIFGLIAGLADPIVNVRIGSVQAGSPAEAAGLQGGAQTGVTPEGVPIYDDSGDLIIAIDAHRFPLFDSPDVADSAPLAYLRARAGQEVTVTVRREDGTVVDVGPIRLKSPEAAVNGALGISVRGFELTDIQRGPLDAAAVGFTRTIDASTLIVRTLGQLASNLGDPPVQGPVGMVTTVGAIRSGFPPVFLLWLVGVLSANLAVINVLPLPPLDGGRMAMALVQRFSGNRVTPALERRVYLTGFMLLMGLLVWITYFDIRRLGGG